MALVKSLETHRDLPISSKYTITATIFACFLVNNYEQWSWITQDFIIPCYIKLAVSRCAFKRLESQRDLMWHSMKQLLKSVSWNILWVTGLEKINSLFRRLCYIKLALPTPEEVLSNDMKTKFIHGILINSFCRVSSETFPG